jgi:acyl carrier protein
MQDYRDKVRNFITHSTRTQELGDSDDIFALGIVNSMFALQLVLFVENEFKMAVETKDLDLANFRSVDSIAEFVQRKKSSAG